MNELQIFNHPDFGQVRTVTMNDEPWFVGKDVAQVLGYEKTADAVRKHTDPEDRGVAKMDTPGGVQEFAIINESGLYSLIFSSKLPDAKKFKKWVTSEVLPSIRKTGSYMAQPVSPAQLIAAQAQLLVDMEQKMLAIQNQTDAIQNQQAELAQRVDTAIKVFSRPSEDHWKSDIDKAIKDMCEERHLSLCATLGRMYRELEQKCGCDINSRLTNLRKRKKKQGARHRDAMALTKLDAIAEDKQLRAAFEGVVREWQVRSAVVDGQQEIAVQDAFSLTE
ncbi:MAG: Bro-N domain-containing protein [Faecousia sp.]